jgi:hypothetical protein
MQPKCSSSRTSVWFSFFGPPERAGRLDNSAVVSVSQAFAIAIRRNAKKIASQMTSVPKAQIQLCVGRMASIIARRGTLHIIRGG